MCPVSQEGLAFPDCQKYFLVAQLVTAVWWLVPDAYNPAAALEVAVVQFVDGWTPCQNVPWKGLKAPYDLTPSMRTTLRAWKTGLDLGGEKKNIYSQSAVSPYSPLWNNPTLLHPKYGPRTR